MKGKENKTFAGYGKRGENSCYNNFKGSVTQLIRLSS